MSKRNNNYDDNASKRLREYDEYYDAEFACTHCKWTGTGSDVNTLSGNSIDILQCPQCKYNELRMADGEIINVILSQELYEDDNLLLSSKQLPDIDGDSKITLQWDSILFHSSNNCNYVVTYNNNIIWQQFLPPYYHEYFEYMLFLKYAIRKYGKSLYDVIPSPSSAISIYGTDNCNMVKVDQLRNKLRARNTRHNSYVLQILNIFNNDSDSLVSSSSIESSEHESSEHKSSEHESVDDNSNSSLDDNSNRSDNDSLESASDNKSVSASHDNSLKRSSSSSTSNSPKRLASSSCEGDSPSNTPLDGEICRSCSRVHQIIPNQQPEKYRSYSSSYEGDSSILSGSSSSQDKWIKTYNANIPRQKSSNKSSSSQDKSSSSRQIRSNQSKSNNSSTSSSQNEWKSVTYIN